MQILFVFPPAKASNEVDTFRMIPDATVTTVGSRNTRRDVDILVPSIGLPYVGAHDRWSAGLAWYRTMAPIDEALRRADVVVTYEVGTATTAQVRKIATAAGVPHVSVAAQTLIDYPIFRAPPWRGYVRRNVPELDGVLCLNERGANCARAFGVPNDRVHVVAFGIDTVLFSPAPQRSSDLAVAFVGDLRPEKGILDAIAAGDLAAPRVGPKFELRVVGDGPLRAKVDAAARTRPWLKILGRLPRHEVPTALRRSRVAMTASWSRAISEEQFGFALVEGMACGLPIVSTTCGAIPSVVPPGNFLAAEHDIEGLADGMVRALQPESDAIGISNRAHALAKYNSRSQAVHLRGVLESIIDRRR